MSTSDFFREKTRVERIENKREEAVKLPVRIATVNLDYDENLALLIRAAACCGASEVLVIGSVPPRAYLKPKTGNLVDYIDIKNFPNPYEFLNYCRNNELRLISSEMYEGSTSLFDFSFDFGVESVIIIGNETTGVPVDVLMNSEIVHIPMPGIGFCLNASQAGTVILNEYVRQWSDR